MSAREVQFLTGIGLRLLIEECWRKRILLVGIAKDSMSSYFYRNYLGSLHIERGENSPSIHAEFNISDRSVLELLPQLIDELRAPWATIEFDSAFMTVLPQFDGTRWLVRGYLRRGDMEYTRTPRLFLKSLAQFLLNPQTKLASHVIFIDRLAYPGWDDKDSEDFEVQRYGSTLGPVKLLKYSSAKPPRLQIATIFLLDKLVRNHYPEALGYPEPLHKADLGAKAFRDSIKRILQSTWLTEKANPLFRTFRAIRESIRGVRGS